MTDTLAESDAALVGRAQVVDVVRLALDEHRTSRCVGQLDAAIAVQVEYAARASSRRSSRRRSSAKILRHIHGILFY